MPLFDTVQWSFTTSVLVFIAAALVIAAGGTRLTAVVDRLADVTGMGEAMAGAILLGATTSLSGSVLSVTAALNNRPELAMGNALGPCRQKWDTSLPLTPRGLHFTAPPLMQVR